MDVRRRFLDDYVEGSIDSDFIGYRVVLNDQWRLSSLTNPDSSVYDGFYESFSNRYKPNSQAVMYIDINGISNFKLYIGRSAGGSDFVKVSQLDKDITRSTSYSDTKLVKGHNYGKSNNTGSSISSYELIEFPWIDGGYHRITVLYQKDSTTDYSNDKGYVIIPKEHPIYVETGVDTTYSIRYTTHSETPVAIDSSVWGSTLKKNIYTDGFGYLCFSSSVKSIPSNGFENMRDLKDIEIPNSVTSIGSNAFKYCEELENINVGKNVTSIGSKAFFYCSGWLDLNSSIAKTNYSFSSVTPGDSDGWLYHNRFTGLTLGENITSIGNYGLEDLGSVRNVIISNKLTSIGESGLEGFGPADLVLPDSVRSIGWCALLGSKITSITFGSGISRLPYQSMQNCKQLSTITWPSSLIFVESGTFTETVNVSRINIESVSAWTNVTFEGEGSNPGGSLYVDGNCVESVVIPSAVTSIGNYAFSNNKLKSVTIGSDVSSIGKYAFRGNNISDITIPNNVNSIGDYAFSYCNSLETVNIGSGISSVGINPFISCPKLSEFNGPNTSLDHKCLVVNGGLFSFAPYGVTSYEIEDGISIIKDYSFSSNNDLLSVTIPDSVTRIGHWAFYNCTYLSSIYCKSATPPSGGNNMFANIASNYIIYVPTSSVDAYKAATYWENYADHIVGYDFSSSNDNNDNITFYIDDGVDVYQYYADRGMSWLQFISSEYANGNSDVISNFRLYQMGSYYTIQCYHSMAEQDMLIFDQGHSSNVKSTDIIEDSRTYYIY